MSKNIPIGTRGEAVERVTFEHTLTAHHSGLPPVFSTPHMIRLMEIACFHALLPYQQGDEITVGTAVHVQHRAAAGIGAEVRAEAVLEKVEGKFYIFGVTAHDGVQEIGRGHIHRAFVSVSRFMQRLAGKTTT